MSIQVRRFQKSFQLNFLSSRIDIADFDCFEQAETGPGRAYFERYAWNSANKTCRKFIYGGLLGNRNNFQSIEQCLESCRDAILSRISLVVNIFIRLFLFLEDKQLNFDSTRRYTAINRLYENYQIHFNIERVENYFKLIVQPDGKLLGVIKANQSISLESTNASENETQYWYLIPTGEKDFYRIKTRSKLASSIDYLLLQVNENGTTYIDVARRNNAYLGQQWRLV